MGHGEGVFGVVDAYPADVPGAPRDLLTRIEQRCVEWRWRLRGRTDRLRRTHGDFHPFNIVFSEGASFTALDASRGGRGEPADDLTALSVNYLFFALQAPGTWERGFCRLWRRFWNVYLAGSGDSDVFHTAAPFLAWRALVLGCVVLLAALVAGQRVLAQPPAGIDIPYKKFVLKNGLTLLVHEDRKAPIVAVNVWYHVGSKNEQPGRTGFAHLFEHLMFEGSAHVKEGEFDTLLEAAGNGLLGMVLFQLSDLLPGAIERRRSSRNTVHVGRLHD